MSKHGLSVEDRFMSYVYADPNCGCWLWGGGINKHGYGSFRVNGKTVGAHRFAYEHFKGEKIPPGLVTDHAKCNMHACVNPAHIELVSIRENVIRGVKSGVAFDTAAKRLRSRKFDSMTHCARGHLYTNPVVDAKTGWRRCRTCWNIRARARYARAKSRAH